MAGFDEFIKYCEKWTDKSLLNDLDKFMKDFVNSEGQEVIAKTKLRTPVDTGALRNAWQTDNYRKEGNSYSIDFYNGMDYASFVEYGTVERNWKWKNGAFMLSKSLNDVQNKIHNDFETKFTKFLKDKGIA